jgi:hypothetical protein
MKLLGTYKDHPIYLLKDGTDDDYCIHYCNHKYILPYWSLGKDCSLITAQNVIRKASEQPPNMLHLMDTDTFAKIEVIPLE